jgi:hypothetical protein
MEVQKFAQPIHHQTIQTLAPNIHPPLDPTPYLPQIGDEMEESLSGISKKRLEILAMNDNTDIRCVIQYLKALHARFDFFSCRRLPAESYGQDCLFNLQEA